MFIFDENFGNCYDHNLENINNIEEREGVYLLGHYDNITNTLIITYVGRGIVKNRLKTHLEDEYKDDKFQYLFTDDEKLSCNLECKSYHKYIINLKNKNHPSLDKGDKCPHPGCNHIGK